ncbi:NIPSNAP protein [Bosea sp. OK403]|uniref:NIPSNAP family protein n=1 Tax=Bosea sp. OK403 TaxID=1855286 RepID=UPI0008E41910|nr:NIPSNAP family protein [Bosea sp. OK403]SFI05715.1 NIPSNAP protein [Bosea sp. OK403]
MLQRDREASQHASPDQRQGNQVFELRRYRLHPGRREALIALFDREFVTTQEEVGIRVVGQFRDLDQPDQFVWFRGFSDMDARRAALNAFYTGPVWVEHGPAANATMIDSDDVLLLKPISIGSGFFADQAEPQASGAAAGSVAGFLIVTHHFHPQAGEAEAEAFARDFARQAREAGATIQASLISETQSNSFPRLPIREGESVAVTVLRSDADMAGVLARLPLAPAGTVLRCVVARVMPTEGSRLR